MPQAFNNTINIAKPSETREYTPEQMMEIARCMTDPVYFCNNYCYIIELDRGLVQVKLYPYQETIIRATITNSFTIAKLPRQSGKTQCVALLVLWLVLFTKSYNVGIVAQNEKTAIGILKRVKTAYQNLPEFLQRGITAWNEKSISFDNGSAISVSGTSAASARGGSFNFLYLDEFAFVPGHIQNEFFDSTLPTIAAGKTGKVLVTSTPKGMNKFYKLWKDSEEGNNDFVRIAIEWSDVPGRDEAWKEKQIRLMGQEGFNQEYNTEFLGSSHTLINAETLRRLTWSKPLSQHNGLDIHSLPATDRSYIVVADVARGVGLDYSACCVIDVTQFPFRLVAKFQNNKINSINYAQLLVSIAKNYNDAYILVEINDIGQEVVDVIYQEFEYTNVFSHHTKNKNKQVDAGLAMDSKSVLGVRTTRLVKRLGCNTLKNLVENNKLVVEDYDIVQQLSMFVQKNNSYEADDGHDDLVMCLVLFGWLSDTKLFKEMSERSFRRELLSERKNQAQQDMMAIGFSTVNMYENVDAKGVRTVSSAQFDQWMRDDWGADPELTDERPSSFFYG